MKVVKTSNCKRFIISLIKRKELRLIIKALSRNPDDSRLRQRFCNLKKSYRSLFREFKRKMNKSYFANLSNYIIQTIFLEITEAIWGGQKTNFPKSKWATSSRKKFNIFQDTSPKSNNRISSQAKSKH